MSRSLRSLFDLSGQVALVTGGSRGLGRQCAEALAEFGAHVVLVSRKRAELNVAAAELSASDYRVDAISCNLSEANAAADLVSEIFRRHGRIDILVNAAGTTWGAKAESHPMDAWAKVMTLNLDSVFRLTQAVARDAMIPAASGKIVNIASVAGFLGHRPERIGTAAYSASKGAIIQLTRALAAEWGPYGINVNALAPGYFPTRMTTKTLDDVGKEIIADTPLRRLGGNSDLKGPLLLLASPAGAYITGHVLVADGGVSII